MPFISLKQALDISPEEQSKLADYNDKIKDVAEFLSEAADAVKDSSFGEALKHAAPWAAEVADSAGDAVPVVKFATSFLSKLLKEKDPEVLGRLACTLAYQRAVEQAVEKIGQPELQTPEVRKGLKEFVPSSAVDFRTMSFSTALSHSFIKEADRALLYYTERAHYSEAQRTNLQMTTHGLFVQNLRLLLSHRESADKFEPFRRLIAMGTVEQSPYEALDNHVDYQRRLFDEARVLNTEPFALMHVYVDTECSHLTWGEIDSSQPSKRKDPFSADLPRTGLLDTVMRLIADPQLDDAIVIQGVAGSGKSSFTLRLCRELLNEGLRPLRIRLRDVPLDMNIRDALPKAVLLHDPDTPLSERGYAASEDVFIGGALFRERVLFKDLQICPYVLILDGWDEVSLSAPEGFRAQVTRMLKEVREEYLKNREPRIRVIVTGRPSIDVTESHFLLQNTPVLTVRTLRPEQLETLVGNLITAIESAPLCGPGSAFANKEQIPHILEQYRKGFSAGDGEAKKPREHISGSMQVFSLPLLAHLAIRLIADALSPIKELLGSPTHLYRSLVDLTLWRRGRFGEGAERIVESTAPDPDLRRKLQQTAVAITVYGKESIPSRELAIRLGLSPKELEAWAKNSTQNHFLTELLINFFFKGGNEKLGCEFLHKSFREYLFAEHVVEVLKAFGRKPTGPWPERPAAEYWKDFQQGSDLWRLSRDLCSCLAAQWLSDEVIGHIEQLTEWEITRADRETDAEGVRQGADPLELSRWEYIRDALADLWDWWGEGVHLRPQVSEDRRRLPVFERSYVEELIEESAPRDVDAQSPGMLTVRTTTIDSHLGYALFRLNIFLHWHLAVKQGWLADRGSRGEWLLYSRELWNGCTESGKGPRCYQTLVRRDDRQWTIFAPSGKRKEYFTFYAARINAAGWRPTFPGRIFLMGVDLRSAKIHTGSFSFHGDCVNVAGAEISSGLVDLKSSLGRDLSLRLPPIGAAFFHCDLENADFSYSLFGAARFLNCNLAGAEFNSCDLKRAEFVRSPTTGAKFDRAHVVGAKFDEVSAPRDVQPAVVQTPTVGEDG